MVMVVPSSSPAERHWKRRENRWPRESRASCGGFGAALSAAASVLPPASFGNGALVCTGAAALGASLGGQALV